jgi:hypothetical protein
MIAIEPFVNQMGITCTVTLSEEVGGLPVQNQDQALLVTSGVQFQVMNWFCVNFSKRLTQHH